MLSAN